MPMSTEAKVRLGQKMKREADMSRCPVCGRGASLKASTRERRVWCRWLERELCTYEEFL